MNIPFRIVSLSFVAEFKVKCLNHFILLYSNLNSITLTNKIHQILTFSTLPHGKNVSLSSAFLLSVPVFRDVRPSI